MFGLTPENIAELKNIMTQFGLKDIVNLKFQSSPPGAGYIEINTIIPTSLPWSGDYFNGNPITITAIPNPGYTFDYWKSTNSIKENNSELLVTLNFDKDDVITAHFSTTVKNSKVRVIR